MKKILLIFLFIICLCSSCDTDYHGKAYVDYDVVYTDTTINYKDTLEYIYWMRSKNDFKERNEYPIRLSSSRGTNYFYIYYDMILCTTAQIRLNDSKILYEEK